MAGDRVAGLLLAALALVGIYLYDSPNRDRLAATWETFTTWQKGLIQTPPTGTNAPDFGSAPVQTIPAPSGSAPPALPSVGGMG